MFLLLSKEIKGETDWQTYQRISQGNEPGSGKGAQDLLANMKVLKRGFLEILPLIGWIEKCFLYVNPIHSVKTPENCQRY